MKVFAERAAFTTEKLTELEALLLEELGTDKERILGNDTAIYVTGSGGRGEMSQASDVDLFIARTTKRNSPVDSFQFLQAIARTFHKMGLDEPSEDGSFLKVHSAAGLCDRMGTPQDDTENTLTARMLLLLESRCLTSTSTAYRELLNRILASYWKNYDEHSADYQPLTLVNDIVRYWRTLILNYVAKNLDAADRRIASYKLRFSRCLTCFSMLSYLLALTGSVQSVSQVHVLDAVQMSPIDRLRWVAETQPSAANHVDRLLAAYARFLEQVGMPKEEQRKQFQQPEVQRQRSIEAQEFGDVMFELLLALAINDRGKYLLRYMVV